MNGFEKKKYGFEKKKEEEETSSATIMNFSPPFFREALPGFVLAD